MAKYERFVCVGDLHGDEQDPGTVAALFDFCRHWKPKHRIHLGDNWDFRWLRAKASDEDKLDPSLQSDFDAGLAFLDQYRPGVFLCGNHDWRVRKAMDSPDPAKSKLAGILWGDMEDALRGVKPLPYNKRDGVYRFGDRNLVHGYGSGIGAVRKHTLVYGSMWMAHIHAVECTTVETLNGAEGRSIGALAKLELGYNESQIGTLRQANGFLYGCISGSGKTISWQAQKLEGSWLFPSEMREVKA